MAAPTILGFIGFSGARPFADRIPLDGFLRRTSVLFHLVFGLGQQAGAMP